MPGKTAFPLIARSSRLPNLGHIRAWDSPSFPPRGLLPESDSSPNGTWRAPAAPETPKALDT
jgi:hypothetical protein